MPSESTSRSLLAPVYVTPSSNKCACYKQCVFLCIQMFWMHVAYSFETISRPKVVHTSLRTTAKHTIFPDSETPFLAVITETSACDSHEDMVRTYDALAKATSTHLVDLVSIRVSRPATNEGYQERYAQVVELARRLMTLAETTHFRLVVSSDWVDAAADAGVDGVHVKEAQWPDLLPEIKQKFRTAHGHDREILLGTSTHSLAGAERAMQAHPPDYFFVGTCFATESHPEKLVLEGPKLPGQVCQRLGELAGRDRPKVFAIGGIDEGNCRILTRDYAADGVAVIRAVSASNDPAQAVTRLKESMNGAIPELK